jgi:hypothetical protein
MSNSVIATVFVVLALIFFLIGVVNAQIPVGRQINWVAAGLALLTIAWLIGRG